MFQTIKKFYNEFKPAILFLVRFCVTFGILSLLYGMWVGSYGVLPDPATKIVTNHTRFFLSFFFTEVSTGIHNGKPAVDIFINGMPSINVAEGCNGIAIFNLFFSFLVGYWGGYKKLVVFSIVGCIIIHICNLIRLVLLGWLSLTNAQAFHFTHKYLFTISIYIVVLILWYFWVSRINPSTKAEATATNNETA